MTHPAKTIAAAVKAIKSSRQSLTGGRNTKFNPKIVLSKEKKAAKTKIM